MARSFFGDVIPAGQGVVVLGDGRQGPSRQSIARDEHDILRRVINAAQAPQRDFYFTPARYLMTESVDVKDNYKGLRTRANCVAKRCVAFDVDLNHDKKPSYTSKHHALGAMLVMCKKLHLPTYTHCIDSGRGLHFYWALGQDIQAHEWRRVMDALKPKLIAADPKLFCDPTRISDLAGYLRLPGSWNTKSGTLVKPFTPAQSVAEWGAFVSASGTPSTSFSVPVAPLRGVQRKASSGMDNEDPKISDPHSLLTRCSALKLLSASPETQDYEGWFGAARIFARAENEDEGRAAFHSFSKGHPQYDAEAVDAKFTEAVGNTTYSPSCQQLRDWVGKGAAACAGCPMFKRQSNGKPAALLADFPETEPLTISPSDDDEAAFLDLQRKAKGGHYMPMSVLGMQAPPGANRAPRHDEPGLFIAENGAMKLRVVEGGEDDDTPEVVDIKAAEGPVWLHSLTRQTAPDGSLRYGVRVAVARKTMDGWEMKTGVVQPEAFSSRSALFAEFVQQKFDITATDPLEKTWRALYRQLSEERRYLTDEKAKEKVSRCGWFDAADENRRRFVIGDRSYTPDGGVELVELREDAVEQVKDLTQRGGLAANKGVFNAFMGKCSTAGQVMVLAALGTPLVHAAPVPGALFFMHGSTGTGKTLMLSYIQSLYGGVDHRAMSRGKDTAASITHSMGHRSAIPFLIDETTEMAQEDLGSLMLSITDGRERNRMHGSVNQLRATNEWNTYAFGSSNNELAANGCNAAEEARLARTIGVDVDQTPLYAGVLPVEEVVASRAHHGVIGPAFLRYVLANYDAVVARVQSYDAKLRAGDTVFGAGHGSDKYRVWRSAAAVVLTTAEIVTAKLKLLEAGVDFTAKLAARLMQMAKHQESMVGVAADDSGGAQNSTVTRSPNHPIMMEFLEEVGQRGQMSVYCVQRPSGDKVTGDALVRALSKTNLVHDPAGVESVQLHITLGSPIVVASFSRNTLREWATHRQRATGYKIDSEFVLRHMRDAGALLHDDARGLVASNVKLPGSHNSVSTLTTDLLPSVNRVWARLELREPADDSMRLVWA